MHVKDKLLVNGYVFICGTNNENWPLRDLMYIIKLQYSLAQYMHNNSHHNKNYLISMT